jgi:CRISPR/Cas system-associated endonuclease Cas3-HD
VKLFEDKIFSFSGLNLTLNAVKHFEEMFEICFDRKIDNKEWIQVIKSIKYVLKHINSDDNDTVAYNIANEMFNK